MPPSSFKLSSTESLANRQGDIALGTKSGGSRFSFGGLNDAPAGPPWLWIGLGVAVLAGLFLFTRKSS